MKIKNCTIEEFIATNRDKQVVAIGIGTELLQVNKEQPKFNEFVNSLDYLCDNSQVQWGREVVLCGRKFVIQPLEEIRKLKNDNLVFVITCLAFVEIANQLSAVPEFENCECYFFMGMKTNPHVDLDRFVKHDYYLPELRQSGQIIKKLGLEKKYKGERCFIIGNGPSLKCEDLELIKEEYSFASNYIFKIFNDTSWRPTFYMATDYEFLAEVNDLRGKFDDTMIFIPVERALAEGKVYDKTVYYHRVTKYIRQSDGKYNIDFSNDTSEVTYGGGSITYDLIQWAVYMGFEEIVFLGMDNTIFSGGGHFYKGNYALETSYDMTEIIDASFIKTKEVSQNQQFRIYNATRGGALELFERVNLEDYLEGKH